MEALIADQRAQRDARGVAVQTAERVHEVFRPTFAADADEADEAVEAAEQAASLVAARRRSPSRPSLPVPGSPGPQPGLARRRSRPAGLDRDAGRMIGVVSGAQALHPPGAATAGGEGDPAWED